MEFSQEIKLLLEEIDSEFDPPMSSTINLNDYALKMCKNATIFSVHEEGKLVAAMAFYSNDPNREVAYGTMLAVSKSHRIYGIGSHFIKATVKYLKKKTFKVYKLEVYKTNPRVISLYKSLNFIVVSETDHSVIFEIKLS